MAFTVFGLSIVLFTSLVFLASPTILEPKFWNSLDSMLLFIISISILILGTFPLLGMQVLRIEKHRLVFQNYVFASFIKEVDLRAYDFFKIVEEESENGFFEAVWLIKDGRLIDSFSTYQYANYIDLKSALNLENKGPLDVSPLKQLCCRFGSKI